LASFQNLGRMLTYKASFDLSMGKPKEAVDESFLAFRLGKRVGNGQMLITWLVGTAVEQMAFNCLDRMTASGKLDEPTLKDIAKRLDESRDLGDLTYALRSERVYVMKSLEDEPPPWDVTRKNLTEVFDFYDTLAKKPVLEALKGENSVQAFMDKRQGDWDAITRSLTPAYDKLFVTCGRRQVTFDALKIRVALTRFKLAKGVYPKDPAELVPQYLDKLPLDPFSGKPYGYRLEPDGNFVLWSVGEDLKDDGGETNAINPWAGPDYVFTSRPLEPPK
jgi:hypothetical protein